MNRISYMITGVILGAMATYAVITFAFREDDSNSKTTTSNDNKKPLYWVAPMDSGFRQDKPGVSPMGMALVPVYNEPDTAPGVVKISPNISQNMGVKTATVSKQALTQQIQTVGYIQYNENLLAHVHPRVAGWINQLFVKSEGIYVEQGDPLFSLYSPELVNAQEEYLLALSRQQNSLIKATEARLKSLQIDEGIIQKIKSQRKSQQNITFYAPQSGVVSRLKVREGFYIQPGNELMTLADLSSVWLEIELTEHKLSWVNNGDQVMMKSMSLPGQTFNGTVDFVYPFLDAKSKTGKVRLAFENSHNMLKPNMIADIQINPKQNIEAIAVPRSAVIRTGNQDRVVWALGDGQFKSVAVELGQSNAEYFAILSGLAVGDEVVTAAQFLIDSESNKMSDFNRFDDMSEVKNTPPKQAKIQSARTTGVINEIDNNVLTISREAIKKWNRPAAKLAFILDPELSDMQKHLSINQRIDFTFEIREDGFVIVAIHEMKMEPHDD